MADFVRKDLRLKRGDTWHLRDGSEEPIVFDDGRTLADALRVWSTVKRYRDDQDPGLSQVNTAIGGVEIVDAETITVTHPRASTEDVPLGMLWYDITVDFSTTDSRVIQYGFVECTARATEPRGDYGTAIVGTVVANVAAPTLVATGALSLKEAFVDATVSAPTLSAAGVLTTQGVAAVTIAAPTLASAGGPPPPPLDDLTVTPNGMWCFSRRLRTAYTSHLFRVRRASDNAEQDIGYVAGTGIADIAALTSFCAGTDGFVKTWYDQSGNGRDLTQSTTASQPKIWDSATGAVLINGKLAALWDTSNDNLRRSDACGLSGAVGATSAAVWTGSTLTRIVTWVGGAEDIVGAALETVTGPSTTTLFLGFEGSSRTFTSPDWTTGANNTIARLAAGAQIGTSKLRRNGTELSQSSVTNGTNTVTFQNTQTVGGRATSPWGGKMGAFAVWGSEISDANAAIWDAFSTSTYGT